MNIKTVVKHPLFKSSLIYAVSDGVNKAIPFFILPVLSYYLLPSDYGIVANFGVLSSIISILIGVGVAAAISVNYYKFTKEELSKYIFNALLIILLAAIIVLVAVTVFNQIIFLYVKVPFQYQLLVVVMALATVITSINLSLWRLEEKPIKFGIYTISQTAVNISISLLLIIVYKLGWVGRVNGILISSVLFGGLSIFILYRRGYLQINFNKRILTNILVFGLPLIPHSLSFWMRSGVDLIFITRFIGEKATGLYATGFVFGTLIAFMTGSFNNAFVPYMYKMLSVDDDTVLKNNKRKLVKMVYLGIVGLVILCIIFTGISNFILDNFFADKYAGSSKFIFWAILSQTFQGMYLFFVNYIFFSKKTKLLAVITFFCAGLQVILSYIMIQKIGSIGAAYATVIVSFINFIAIAYYSNKVYRMPWLGGKI